MPVKDSLRRAPSSHKGDYGHVLIAAGSRGMAGAALLAAEAAALAGAGKVTLAVPQEVYPLVARRALEVMTLPLPSSRAGAFAPAASKAILKFAAKADAVAVGPGLSLHPAAPALAKALWNKLSKPLVVDADGLNALAAAGLEERRGSAVLTPHDGEFARLSGTRPPKGLPARKRVAKSFSKKYHCVLVLKGHRTVVAAPDGRTYVNRTGNAGMATGGAGDVLTGMIASFIAQRFEPYLAACLAVHAHGKAGDKAARQKGQTSLLARDLLAHLPAVMKALEKRRHLRPLLE